MSDPQVTSMELSTGTYVPLSFDLETGTPVEIVLTGSNLENLEEIQLDSGPLVGWYITDIVSNGNSAVITAYATGEPGPGYINLVYRTLSLKAVPVDDFWIGVAD